MCPLKATKPTPKLEEDDEAADYIERLARRRDSGFALDAGELSALAFELLLLRDSIAADFERQDRHTTRGMLTTLTRAFG